MFQLFYRSSNFTYNRFFEIIPRHESESKSVQSSRLFIYSYSDIVFDSRAPFRYIPRELRFSILCKLDFYVIGFLARWDGWIFETDRSMFFIYLNYKLFTSEKRKKRKKNQRFSQFSSRK